MKTLKTHYLNLFSQKPTTPFISKTFSIWEKNGLVNFRVYRTKPIYCCSSSSSSEVSPLTSRANTQVSSSSSLMASKDRPDGFSTRFWVSQSVEEGIEKAIYRSRFVTLLGVFGSLVGSLLCFIKGCNIVAASFIEHAARSGKSMVFLVEAIDVYLLGTVMMVFGMGLYELFVCNLDIANSLPEERGPHRSNLFGLFTLMLIEIGHTTVGLIANNSNSSKFFSPNEEERPKWLEIKSVNELKTKVGHVIVMLLLIGLFDNSKKAAIHTPTDLLCFSASVLLCSGCLYLLSKLNGSK